jgi:uncharacterized protein YgiM (DUF1202 family)
VTCAQAAAAGGDGALFYSLKHEWIGQKAAHLPAKKGEILLFIEKTGKNLAWWQMQNAAGQTGKVPSNYLTEEPVPAPSWAQPAASAAPAPAPAPAPATPTPATPAATPAVNAGAAEEAARQQQAAAADALRRQQEADALAARQAAEAQAAAARAAADAQAQALAAQQAAAAESARAEAARQADAARQAEAAAAAAAAERQAAEAATAAKAAQESQQPKDTAAQLTSALATMLGGIKKGDIPPPWEKVKNICCSPPPSPTDTLDP